jgi:5'-methylthioadenosine phosphorylase
LNQNAANACQVVALAVKNMPAERSCECGSALRHALITDKKLVPQHTIQKLEPIVGKYFAQ